MAPSVLRVILTDHDASSRTRLRRLLTREPCLALLGHCASAAGTLALVEHQRPDVLLLDLSLPAGASLDVIARVSSMPPAVPTLALAQSTQAATLMLALTSGARGVVDKDAPPSVLLESIRTVAAGGYWVAPDQLTTIIDTLRVNAPAPNMFVHRGGEHRPFGLTRRELDIVAAIAAGESNKEIAERLAVKECTVKHHVSSVFDKLGVFSRLQLAMFAVHHHLVSLSEFLP